MSKQGQPDLDCLPCEGGRYSYSVGFVSCELCETVVHLAWLDLPHVKRVRKAGTRSTVKEAELAFRVLLGNVVKVDWVGRICWIKRLIL